MKRSESLAVAANAIRTSGYHLIKFADARSHGLAAVRAIRDTTPWHNCSRVTTARDESRLAFRSALKACGFTSNQL